MRLPSIAHDAAEDSTWLRQGCVDERSRKWRAEEKRRWRGAKGPVPLGSSNGAAGVQRLWKEDDT